ncbi:MAG: caspase family protein [Pirellulales bacterium]
MHETPTRPAGKSLAILVGIQNYPASPLKYCHNDVHRLAKVLRDECGYDEVEVLLDDRVNVDRQPTLGNLSKQIRQALIRADRNGYQRVLFYYSGHGYRDSQERLYLAPNDYDAKNIPLTCFPLQALHQMLDNCEQIPIKFIVLDCCHAGAGRGDDDQFGGHELQQVFRKSRGTLTLASSLSNEKSLEWDEKGQGVFTYWLCEGLLGQADRDKDGLVDHDELHKFVFARVDDTARKMRQEQTVKLIPSQDWRGVAVLAGNVRPRASTSDNVSLEMSEAVRLIDEYVTKAGPNEHRVTVGDFHYRGEPGSPQSSAGVALVRSLTEQLHKAGYTTDDRARWSITGSFWPYQDSMAANRDVGVFLAFEVTDRRNPRAEPFRFERGILGDSEVTSLTGPNVALDLSQSRDDQQQAIADSLDHPRCRIRDGIVYANEASPYGVQILVKNGTRYEPIPASERAGVCHVSLGLEQVYAIRVHNRSGKPAAIRVLIDGLDMFGFADYPAGRNARGTPKYTHLVTTGESCDVLGWYANDSELKEFLVKAYSPAAPPFLRNSTSIGMISVQFHAAWRPDDKLPMDEHNVGVPKYTDAGGRIKRGTAPVAYNIGHLQSTVTIRYSK